MKRTSLWEIKLSATMVVKTVYDNVLRTLLWSVEVAEGLYRALSAKGKLVVQIRGKPWRR